MGSVGRGFGRRNGIRLLNRHLKKVPIDSAVNGTDYLKVYEN
jgi:hypothetical protein